MMVNFRRSASPEINLTPMIDVLFMVLMFLLLTTTFKEFTFLRVTLPDASAGERSIEQPDGIRILIEESGAVHLGERLTSVEELGRQLLRVRDKQHVDVLVAADARVKHGLVVDVLDAVRRAGIFRLSIETVSEGQSVP